MKQIVNKLELEKREYLIFVVLLSIYILLDVQLPTFMADAVDTIYGQIVIYLLAAHIFINVNKLAGILAFIAAYKMIKRASKQTGTLAIRKYVPSEVSKVIDFSKYNDFPYTLEEEEVARMAPLVENNTTGSDFKPVLDSLNFAAPTDYNGVI
jgi:hypothetical protein